jgi:hypothetical protein
MKPPQVGQPTAHVALRFSLFQGVATPHEGSLDDFGQAILSLRQHYILCAGHPVRRLVPRLKKTGNPGL